MPKIEHPWFFRQATPLKTARLTFYGFRTHKACVTFDPGLSSKLLEFALYTAVIALGLWAMVSTPLDAPTTSTPLELKGLALVELMGRTWPRKNQVWLNKLSATVLFILKVWEKKEIIPYLHPIEPDSPEIINLKNGHPISLIITPVKNPRIQLWVTKNGDIYIYQKHGSIGKTDQWVAGNIGKPITFF